MWLTQMFLFFDIQLISLEHVTYIPIFGFNSTRDQP